MADMFATPAELASHLQVPEVDTASATLAIEGATGAVQAACGGQRMLPVADDTVTLRGGARSVWLPQRPVTAVGAVTTISSGVVTARVLGTDYTVFGAELVWAPRYGVWPEFVTVTYSHGWTTIPAAVKGVCLSLAGRLYANPQGLRSETVGAVSWTVAGASSDVGPGLTEAELSALAAFRLPVLA